jgi:hypothetical protein
MPHLLRKPQLHAAATPALARHTVPGSAYRAEAEAFVRQVFAQHYQADVRSFAPNLTLLESAGKIIASAGWRGADNTALFLEQYLDGPIEQAISHLAGEPIARQQIVEVGNLAASKAGGSLQVILALAPHLAAQGYEWVTFTATNQLIGIFRKIGLPLLALAPARAECLGSAAADWGSYYDSQPIVVAGRIQWAFERKALWS